MEEAKNKEKKLPEKTEEKEKEKGQQPTGKGKEKKEEQELVNIRTFQIRKAQGKRSFFAWVTVLVDNMVEKAESVVIQQWISLS